MSSNAWLEDALGRSRWLQSLAMALVRDPVEADDLVQETWAKALSQPPREPGSLRIWLERVLRNLIAERARTSQRHAELEERMVRVVQPEGSPEETALRLETQHALTEVLLNLPEPYRTTLRLHYYDGLDLRQIARREGSATRTIETRLRRGRAMMRNELLKRGPAERWVHGLMLLAWPRLRPAANLAWKAGVGAAALGVLLTAAVLWRDGHDADASPTDGDGAAASLTAAVPQTLVPADSPPLPVSRIQASLTPLALLRAVDESTRAQLADVPIRVEFFDAANALISTGETLSRASAPGVLPLPRAAVQARIHGGSSRTHGVPDGSLRHSIQRGATSVEIDVVLTRRRGTVQGRLQRPDGSPVAGGEVGVWAKADARPGSPPLWSAPTDEQGAFVIEEVKAPRQEVLIAAWPSHHPSEMAWQVHSMREDLAADEIVQDVLLVQGPARNLHVLVQSAQGMPIPGARVTAMPGSEAPLPSPVSRGGITAWPQHVATCDESGRVVFPLPHDETWRLVASHPDHVAATVDCAARTVAATIAMEPVRLLRGVVRDVDGLPIGGATVRLQSEGGEESATTLADGSYRLAVQVPSGEEIRLLVLDGARHAAQAHGPWPCSARDEVMDFALQPGAVLEVALLTPTGEPWPADASVSADWDGGPRARRPGKADEWDDASAWIAGKRRSAWDRALAGGKLRAAGLSAGSYRVVFQDEHGWLAECMVETGQPAAVVRAGTYLSARGALQVRAGSSDAAANQEGCRLVLRRRDERGLGGGLTRRLSPAHPVALYRGLEAGRWELRAMGTDSEAIVRQELVIHADQTLDLTLHLPPGRTGTLALLAADGTPLPDAWVVVLDAAGNRLPQGEHDEAVTDAAGRARLSGLPLDDALQIEVRRPDGGVVRTALGAFDPALGVWSAALPR